MRQAESERGPYRAVGPARLPLAAVLCSKLLIIFTLIELHDTGLRWRSGASARHGVGPLPVRFAAGPKRALLSQPSGAPMMATRAEARFVPPEGPEEGGGSVLLPGLVPPGTALGPPPGDNLQPSAAACCEFCRALPDCTAFWYCDREGGCTDDAHNLAAPHQACQLLHQNETAPGTGRPILLMSAPAFIAGAPLRYAAPPVEGYDAYPGLGFWYRYDFPCDDSVSQPGSCGLDGSPQQNAPRCSADADCHVMMWFPDGRDYPGAGRPVVLLKGGVGTGALDVADANVNLNAVLYRKKAAAAAAGSGGGLSAGAIAGIAVGAACAAVALAAGAIIWARRRQRLALQNHSSKVEAPASCDASVSSCCMMGAANTCFWASQSAPAAMGAGGSATAAQRGQPCKAGSWDAPTGWGMMAGTWPATSGGFSRLVFSPGMQHNMVPAGRWAEGMPPSAGSALDALPPGQLRTSLDHQGQLALGGKTCPPSPPPSAANSMAHAGLPGGGIADGMQVPVPASAVAPAGQLPGAVKPGAPVPPVASPRAVGSPGRAAAAAGHPLLSQLPTYGWQRCLVDYAAIEFVRDEEGCPVELGSGASATVYQVLLNGVEPHAAKVFRLGSDPRAQLDFLEEASLLRLLRHRSIVGFAGVCVARGHGIILMELMEGGDLRNRNAEVDEWGLRRFGWYQRGKKVALDIATAIHYLHSSSYTHFDIKSRNVLLTRDLTAKLADVGFTRALRTTHHSVEGPIGTLDYMSPELLLNHRKCTNKVDIFSFGCLLHELCTGQYPSRGCLRDLHVPLEAPAEVAALLSSCLQEDPALRPTAKQLVQTLMTLQ